MDGRAQLHSLAHAISGASEGEAAWAGTGPAVDTHKTCGVCGDHQPVRLPFLRHVCRACAAIWVPGICGDCAHTSVTFTMDGQLSDLARCGCGGQLRQLAFVPKPRATVDPEVAAARKVVVEQQKKHAAWASRSVLVVVAVLATVGGVQLVRHNHAAPKSDPVAPVVHRDLRDDPSLTMTERGRLAGARLTANGQLRDVFGCAAELPSTTSTSPGNEAISHEGSNAGSSAFLAACLAR